LCFAVWVRRAACRPPPADPDRKTRTIMRRDGKERHSSFLGEKAKDRRSRDRRRTKAWRQERKENETGTETTSQKVCMRVLAYLDSETRNPRHHTKEETVPCTQTAVQKQCALQHRGRILCESISYRRVQGRSGKKSTA